MFHSRDMGCPREGHPRGMHLPTVFKLSLFPNGLEGAQPQYPPTAPPCCFFLNSPHGPILQQVLCLRHQPSNLSGWEKSKPRGDKQIS